MYLFKNCTLLIALTAFFTACNQEKEYDKADFKTDSIHLLKMYSLQYSKNANDLKSVHSTFPLKKDSTLQAINHQLYSDYLLKNTKYDSAYYYLTLAGNFFKNNNYQLFINSMKKVNITNYVGLLSQSEIEINYSRSIDFPNKNLKNIYINAFSLPYLKKFDSITYIKLVNQFTNSDDENSEIIKLNPLLEISLTRDISKYLLQEKKYNNIIKHSNKRIQELLKNARVNENLFFSNLYYSINAKIKLYDPTVQNDFKIYKNNLHNIPTKESEILYYFLKANYFTSIHKNDSASQNLKKALAISKEADDFIYENFILEQFIKSNIETKKYINEHIKNNDSLLSYQNYVNDFIFATNTNTLKLKSEQQSIQKQNVSIIAFTFLLLFTLTLYYFIYRNIKTKQLARKHRTYLEEKTLMYKYLIEIKEQMDASILKENNKTKKLINNNAILKIDELLELFEGATPDLELIQDKIKEIEDQSRNISHSISNTNYEILYFAYIINDIKKQYDYIIKIETYFDNSIVLSDLEFKTLLRIMLFTHKFIDKVKFKENVICFISIYKHDYDTIYKIWVNKSIDLSNEQLNFFNDRLIRFQELKGNEETTLLIHLS